MIKLSTKGFFVVFFSVFYPSGINMLVASYVNFEPWNLFIAFLIFNNIKDELFESVA